MAKIHMCNGKVERAFFQVTTKVGRKSDTGVYRSRHQTPEAVRGEFEKRGHKVVSVVAM